MEDRGETGGSCPEALGCSLCPPMPARSGFEEGGAGPRKEHARSDSENWRSLREEQEEDGSWRLGAGPRRDGDRRDGDRWRSTSPGKMGRGGLQDLPPDVCGSREGLVQGKPVAMHVSSENVPRKTCWVGRPGELRRAGRRWAGH